MFHIIYIYIYIYVYTHTYVYMYRYTYVYICIDKIYNMNIIAQNVPAWRSSGGGAWDRAGLAIETNTDNILHYIIKYHTTLCYLMLGVRRRLRRGI